jgi:hypothetical protein
MSVEIIHVPVAVTVAPISVLVTATPGAAAAAAAALAAAAAPAAVMAAIAPPPFSDAAAAGGGAAVAGGRDTAAIGAAVTGAGSGAGSGAVSGVVSGAASAAGARHTIICGGRVGHVDRGASCLERCAEGHAPGVPHRLRESVCRRQLPAAHELRVV